MLPTHRPPTPPGAMLLEEYLKPRGITQVDLAARMGVPVQRVNTLINGKRGVTAETAILLSVESKPSWPRIAAHDGQLTSSYTSALRHALAAERRVLFELRARSVIGDDAFHRVEQELDWAELNTESMARRE